MGGSLEEDGISVDRARRAKAGGPCLEPWTLFDCATAALAKQDVF